MEEIRARQGTGTEEIRNRERCVRGTEEPGKRHGTERGTKWARKGDGSGAAQEEIRKQVRKRYETDICHCRYNPIKNHTKTQVHMFLPQHLPGVNFSPEPKLS